MHRAPIVLSVCLAWGAWWPAGLDAQTSLVETRVLVTSPLVETWSFPVPLPVDSLTVNGMSQLTLPFAWSVSPLRNWRIDVSGAYTRTRVRTRAGATGARSSLSLDGMTDAAVRVTGGMIQDRVWLTFGLNLPVGRTGLSNDESTALRVIGASAFRANTPVLGSGLGATAGLVWATTVGGWAVGLGASYELRARYTPLDAVLASGGGAAVELDPGEAVHLSLALERIAGPGRMSILLVGDRYGEDRVMHLLPGGDVTRSTSYQLGPTLAARWEYWLAGPHIRDLHISVSERYRLRFRDDAGVEADGSNGSMTDASLSVTFGRPTGIGIVAGLNGVFDTGLEVDETLATAAMTAGALTLGLDVRSGRFALQPFVRGTLGRLDTGPSNHTVRAFAGGLTLRIQF